MTDRPLTTTDLIAFKPKEIAIFVDKNGNSSVAIRTNEKNLNKELLNSYGIITQKLGQNKWLLFSEPPSLIPNGRTKFSLGSIWPNTIGKITLGDFSGHIKVKDNGYAVEIPKTKLTGNVLPSLPLETVAALAFQPGNESGLSSLLNQIDLLLEPLKTITSEQLVNKIKENGAVILLTNNNFLIETSLESTFLFQTIQTAAAFQSPTVETMNLPDGSLADEIIVDPSKVDFGSVWIKGQEAKSVETPNGSLLALDGEKTDIIASDSSLLEQYLNKKTEKVSPTCGSKNNLVYLKPKELENTMFGEHNSITSPSLLQIALKFNEIAVDNNKIYLCY